MDWQTSVFAEELGLCAMSKKRRNTNLETFQVAKALTWYIIQQICNNDVTRSMLVTVFHLIVDIRYFMIRYLSVSHLEHSLDVPPVFSKRIIPQSHVTRDHVDR